MQSISIFVKPSGSGLSRYVENLGRSALDVVRQQLFFIRDHHFSDNGTNYPDWVFPAFIRLPLVSGYILGLVGAALQSKKIKLSDVDVLRVVMDIDNTFSINNIDPEISINYMIQHPMFVFGLKVGAIDVENNASSSQLNLLVAICMIFLQYKDQKALKLNLNIFCKQHRIGVLDAFEMDAIVKRWDVHKEFDMVR